MRAGLCALRVLTVLASQGILSGPGAAPREGPPFSSLARLAAGEPGLRVLTVSGFFCAVCMAGAVSSREPPSRVGTVSWAEGTGPPLPGGAPRPLPSAAWAALPRLHRLRPCGALPPGSGVRFYVTCTTLSVSPSGLADSLVSA